MQKFLVSLPKVKIKSKSPPNLPQTPGVYIFFSVNKPIYIGKAINLKRRIQSYFDLKLEPKTTRMIAEADSISYIKVVSELEALLLEAKLIRKYLPHYNIAAKDDKHPLYIQITAEKFPRVITIRKVDLNKSPSLAIFGPFPASDSVHSVLRMLRKIFPYSDHKLGKQGCLYSHIGLCNPCPNEIVRSTQHLVLRKKYLKNIRGLKFILSGKIGSVRKELQKEMSIFSKDENYEEAKKVRDQIEKLDYITRPQVPTDFYLQNPNLYEDSRAKEISELRDVLTGSDLVIKKLERIECFDIAHISGTNPVASMVTFVNAEPAKEYYRHFKIKKAKGGDDYDCLREVAKRREKHITDWGKPDLIIVDGGKGQVSAFTNILSIPVIGIAKNPDRLVIGNDKIMLTGPALNLVSRIRDEAHRFARRYHHRLISKVYQK